ncbi:MAG TPA: RluA family pseudouridine synthase [Acetobacteraceae bacterium]|nr:RluA family pseudouridine synthase [Acetobacteraceae bacterium]
MSVATRTVTEDEAEIRLDRWFRRHFPGTTQGVIQKLCRTGQVRVDGRRAEAATRLLPGQAVRVPPMTAPAEPRDPPAVRPPDPVEVRALERRVLWRDEQVLVLDKPYGLPVQGGPGITRHLDAMLDGLRFGAAERPRLVHRLDRDTSGVLVLARTPGVAAKLAAAFRGRAVRKIYWALVAGRPVPPEGRIDLALVRRPGAGVERVAVAALGDAEAARALTEYRTLDHAGKRVAWLELSPLTGRTHQLRVHCAAIGTPILGDEKYGRADDEGGRIDAAAEGLHLHARAIRFPHPAGGWLEVAADLPAHMRQSFSALGFAAPAVTAPVREG